MTSDPLTLYDKSYASRFLLGTALYASPKQMMDSIKAAETQMITVSLRRESAEGKTGNDFFDLVKSLNCDFLPNTAGCFSVKEAVNTAYMAREVFQTNRLKLEVIGHRGTLQPDPLKTIEAAKILIQDGFQIYPYITDDYVICRALVDAGCRVLMPWAAPIGTGKGITNPYSLMRLRENFPDIPLIIDAGLGAPSHAAYAMELGYDAVLMNTAVAKAGNPVLMAHAFKEAIAAGRKAYHAHIMPPQDEASASTPEFGTPFSPF